MLIPFPGGWTRERLRHSCHDLEPKKGTFEVVMFLLLCLGEQPRAEHLSWIEFFFAPGRAAEGSR